MTTIDQGYLAALSNAITAFRSRFDEVAGSIETIESLNYERQYAEFSGLADDILEIANHRDFFQIELEYRVDNGGGRLMVDEGGKLKVIELWNEDHDLAFAPVPAESLVLIGELEKHLSSNVAELQIRQFCSDLVALTGAGVHTEVKLTIMLDKTNVLKRLRLPEFVFTFLFIFQANAGRYFSNVTLTQLSNVVHQKSVNFVLFLIADVKEMMISADAALSGLDRWGEVLGGLTPRAFEQIKPMDFSQFRDNEVQSEIRLGALKPNYFFFEELKAESSPLSKGLSRLCLALSVVHLANRLYIKDNLTVCVFVGQRIVEVNLENENSLRFQEVFRLFEWAYENFSSDKLQIVRQIICIEIGRAPQDPLKGLAAGASQMLQIAKINFAMYLRKNVAEYFNARLKTLELLNSLQNALGSVVTALTSELVENVYKIAGILIALFATYLIKPDLSPAIVLLTCWGVLIYFLLQVHYVLPSIYIKYRANKDTFEKSLKNFLQILTKDEITELRGTLFMRSIWSFRVFFGLTNLFYVFSCLLLAKLAAFNELQGYMVLAAFALSVIAVVTHIRQSRITDFDR